jgi:hypothetical protein
VVVIPIHAFLTYPQFAILIFDQTFLFNRFLSDTRWCDTNHWRFIVANEWLSISSQEILWYYSCLHCSILWVVHCFQVWKWRWIIVIRGYIFLLSHLVMASWDPSSKCEDCLGIPLNAFAQHCCFFCDSTKQENDLHCVSSYSSYLFTVFKFCYVIFSLSVYTYNLSSQ